MPVKTSYSPEDVIIGCVADQQVKYLEQAFRLLVSWRRSGGRLSKCRFIICVVGGIPPGYAASMTPWFPEFVEVDSFTAAHPPSNKLRFLELELIQKYDRVILLDCDTIILHEPLDLLGDAPLLAKMADIATVPDTIFTQLYAAVGSIKPEPKYSCTVSGEASIPYFNAGVLSFSKKAIQDLVPTWLRLNRKVAEHPEWLGEAFGFLEQATLSLAITNTNTEFSLLSSAMNFPAHFQDPPIPSLTEVDPIILHYHGLINDFGYLAQSPYPLVQCAIQEFNVALTEAWVLRYRALEEVIRTSRFRGGIIAKLREHFRKSCLKKGLSPDIAEL
ncbi:MAG: hypothetical protein ACP5GA_09000 [Acidithiobacillus sp.]